jgi:hypothetical protein
MILIRCIHDKNFELIQSFVLSYSSFCVFGPLVAKSRIRLDRNLVCELLLPSSTLYVQSFGTLNYVTFKSRSNQKPRYYFYVMYP